MQRRDFFKAGAAAGLAASLPFSMFGQFQSKKARIGFIGVGLRGRNHLNNLLLRDDVIITAICDTDPDALAKAQKMISSKGHGPAGEYTGSTHAYRDLLQRSDVDGVIISTPWLWHTRMAVDAMHAGKYAGVEVSVANTLQECWDLVNAYEETGVPVMIMENVCYRRDVMAVLQMVREGLFGELIHARCGYQHDLREVKFNNGTQPYGGGVEFGEKGFSEAGWRTEHSLHRNGDLYPTHGAGPVATMFNINRGNRFRSLTSSATKSLGLDRYIRNHPEGGPHHPNAGLNWKLGDVITSTISTVNGETIIVTHDCNSPRPYSLGFRVQGTAGITEFDDHTRRIYIENKSPSHGWEEMDEYLEKYDHPMWKRHGDYAEGSGHGGMDFFVDHAFVEIVKRKLEAPLDAYDAAAWSAITPLSERSIENNGEPQDFPDFTRGRWMKRKPAFALGDDF
ncbi:MAG: Gfo/Idh/MocA family oxidoreductase [Bacteroidales bacterium]|nr:Gfo/Idh/MocA family oxidoreductase [Bacteroidales bacterium]